MAKSCRGNRRNSRKYGGANATPTSSMPGPNMTSPNMPPRAPPMPPSRAPPMPPSRAPPVPPPRAPPVPPPRALPMPPPRAPPVPPPRAPPANAQNTLNNLTREQNASLGAVKQQALSTPTGFTQDNLNSWLRSAGLMRGGRRRRSSRKTRKGRKGSRKH